MPFRALNHCWQQCEVPTAPRSNGSAASKAHRKDDLLRGRATLEYTGVAHFSYGRGNCIIQLEPSQTRMVENLKLLLGLMDFDHPRTDQPVGQTFQKLPRP